MKLLRNIIRITLYPLVVFMIISTSYEDNFVEIIPLLLLSPLIIFSIFLEIYCFAVNQDKKEFELKETKEGVEKITRTRKIQKYIAIIILSLIFIAFVFSAFFAPDSSFGN